MQKGHVVSATWPFLLPKISK